MARIPTTAARYLLELDGQPCGFLRSVEGGSIRGEVVAEAPESQHFLKKHLASAGPEPIVIALGLSMAPDVVDWIAAAWDGKLSPRDGAIVFADASLKQTKRLVFERAVVAAVGFPAMDGASKDAAYATVTIQPERTEWQKASGKLDQTAAPKMKEALASAFRVEIAAVNANLVAKVAPFTVETKPVAVAGERRVRKGMLTIDFPDLRFTLAEKNADDWLAWHEDFVVKGNSDDAHERTGSLAFLQVNLKKALLRVELEGLGIYRLAPEKAEAGAESVARLRADVYCERMALSQ